MNEFLLYVLISLISLGLFYLWFRRQGVVAEKKWLLAQVSTDNQATSTDNQQKQLKALKQLSSSQNSFKITLLVGLMIIPAALLIDYIWFQDIPFEQRVQNDQPQPDNEAPDLATAVAQLEQKLAQNPDDLDGQLLYGRSMKSLQRFDLAVQAYRKANELDPNNATILTELAEAIAFQNNTGSFLGEPETYLSQAMAVDPDNQKAMWLQGIVYYENLNYVDAENIWQKLLIEVDSPNIKSTITKQINQARAAQNKPLIETSSINTQISTAATADNESSYFVVIDATDEIKAMQLSAGSRIFLFAKQVDGPPMPVAAVPLNQPFNWPMSVSLTDANSLNPNRKLSDFTQIELSAKLSLSGIATPAADDIKSDSITIERSTTNITLTLQPN